MGQHWKLVNIDKRAMLSTNGAAKLEEIYPGGIAEQLIKLLQVPDLPLLSVTETALATAKARW